MRKLLFVSLVLLISCLSLFSQTSRTEKVQALYDTLVAYDIDYPKTVTAIAIMETGWLECKQCAFRNTNLFGFRGSGRYMRFESQSACIAYLKEWQQKNYLPWRQKHPKSSYHHFLVYMKYAENMPVYLRHITNLENWLKRNIKLQ